MYISSWRLYVWLDGCNYVFGSTLAICIQMSDADLVKLDTVL